MLDLNAPLDRLIVLIKTMTGFADDTDGVAHVYKGVPGSLPTRTSAYVALAGPRFSERATQVQTVEVAYFVAFGYRIDPTTEIASLAAAETAVCDGLAGFSHLMKQAVNRTLNNGTTDLVRNAWLEDISTASPQYMPLASQEHRILPLLVWTQQDQTY